jgi:hypothetical protein
MRQTTDAWHARVTDRKAGKGANALPLTAAMHGVLRVLRAGRYASFQPHALMHALWASAGHLFPPYTQCCAAECVTHLLDKLTDELGDAGGAVVRDLFGLPLLLTTTCDAPRTLPVTPAFTPTAELHTAIHTESHTDMESSLHRCDACGHTNSRREGAHTLPLPLPGAEDAPWYPRREP